MAYSRQKHFVRLLHTPIFANNFTVGGKLTICKELPPEAVHLIHTSEMSNKLFVFLLKYRCYLKLSILLII